jgi:hypothetical protein
MPSSALGYGKPPGTKRPKTQTQKARDPRTRKRQGADKNMPTIVKYENYFWPHSSLTSSAVRINEKVRLLELYGTVNQKINAVNIPPVSYWRETGRGGWVLFHSIHSTSMFEHLSITATDKYKFKTWN